MDSTVGRLRLRALPMWVDLVAVTLLAAVLRFPRLGYLSLSVDEGFTLLFGRQSWAGVLGFDGFYDFHPPLFFALGKLANCAVPETLAARFVAAGAGVATVPVFQALAARLLDRRAALCAALLLAVSPLHVFLSRFGRMYTLVVLAVVLSYLCLVALSQTPRPAWAAGYGVSLAVAVYGDYSAAYALAPQIVWWGYLARNGGRRGRWLALALAGAALAYLPWLPEVVATIENSARYGGGGREYLDVTRENARTAALFLLGYTNYGSTAHGNHRSAWDRWPEAHRWLVLALVPIVVAGVLALRRTPRALALTALLLVGIPVATIAASQLSPGFAARTMLAVVPGWALLVSACFARPAIHVQIPGPVRTIGIAGWCLMMAVSIATLPTVYYNGSRKEFRETAAALASQSTLAKPVILPSTAGMLTDVMDAYEHDAMARMRVITLVDGLLEKESGSERWITRGLTRDDVEQGRLAELLPAGDPGSDAVWYLRRTNDRLAENALRDLGYEPLTEVRYFRSTLMLFARPGADLGRPIDVNGGFAGGEHGAGGWKLPKGRARFEAASGDDGGRRILVLSGAGKQPRASYAVGAAVPGLYTLEVATRGGGAGGTDAISTTLQCRSAADINLRSFTIEQPPAGDSATWRTMRVSVLCPSGTSTVVVVLKGGATQETSFREPRLVVNPSADA